MPSIAPACGKPKTSWRPTKIMNMRDLSKDDDFLSHLLVEKLGTGAVPLIVHKMDPSRRLPKTDAKDLLAIVQRLVSSKAPVNNAVRQAVDELLSLPPVRYYFREYNQQQINAFATHASRYFELYHPSGSIEISHTSRYSHKTGKSELCILATRYLAPGSVILELKGSMANLTDEEDRELKRTGLRNSDIRRDFSVIHSKQMKKNHLFLGPARFVNHDCDNNCELFREGKYITFRVIKPIAMGEEITAHYGNGYFGKRNRHCLCHTCELAGRGGYAPAVSDEEMISSDSSSDSDSDTSSDSESEEEEPTAPLNLDERRTRRGVYAVVIKGKEKAAESETDDESIVSLPNNETSGPGQKHGTSLPISCLTPVSRSTSKTPSALSQSPNPSPTRPTLKGHKPRSSFLNQQLVTPPLSEEAASEANGTPTRRITRSQATSASPPKAFRRTAPSTPTKKGLDKGKARESIVVKTEEIDPKLTRVPATAPAFADEDSSQASRPTGPDGKPLPLCVTCFQVMPVISIDKQVVWGQATDASPQRKKNAKSECPRCLRHFSIYGTPWPRRIPLPGTQMPLLPTPQEEVDDTPNRLSRKTLAALDRKLAAAASSSNKGTPKKNKILDNGHTPKELSAPVSQPPASEFSEQPTSSSQNSPSKSIIEQPQHDKKLSEKLLPLSRAERAREREIQREKQTNNPSISKPLKRAREDEQDDNDSPASKRGRTGEVSSQIQRLVPRNFGFKMGRLLSKPSPLNYAIRAWAGTGLPGAGHIDVTPQNCVETKAEFSSPPSPIRLPQGSLTFRPSPTNFARRRWSLFYNKSLGTLGTKVITPSRLITNHIPPSETFGDDDRIITSSLLGCESASEASPSLPYVSSAPSTSKDRAMDCRPDLLSSHPPSLVRAGWDSSSDSD